MEFTAEIVSKVTRKTDIGLICVGCMKLIEAGAQCEEATIKISAGEKSNVHNATLHVGGCINTYKNYMLDLYRNGTIKLR